MVSGRMARSKNYGLGWSGSGNDKLFRAREPSHWKTWIIWFRETCIVWFWRVWWSKGGLANRRIDRGYYSDPSVVWNLYKFSLRPLLCKYNLFYDFRWFSIGSYMAVWENVKSSGSTMLPPTPRLNHFISAGLVNIRNYTCVGCAVLRMERNGIDDRMTYTSTVWASYAQTLSNNCPIIG